jgi:hypothetical protein
LVAIPCWLGACGSEDPGRPTPPASGNGGEAGEASAPSEGGAAGDPSAAGGTDAGGVPGAVAGQAGEGGEGLSEGGAAGGGGSAEAGAAGAPAELEPLLPWKPGNSWTYEVTESGSVSVKTTTVGALQAVGGTGPAKALEANAVITTKGTNGNDETRSWQVLDGERVIRYREQSFGAATGALEQEEYWEPYKVHIDWSPERLLTGATWTETYKETKLPVGGSPGVTQVEDTWRCVAAAESVTVPAGTFTAVVFEKTAQSSAKKTYYYARGVGKLKEVGVQTEELVSFSVD